MRVAQRVYADAGNEIEVAAPRTVSEPAAFSIGNMERLPTLLEAPGAKVVLPGDGGNLLGGEFF